MGVVNILQQRLLIKVISRLKIHYLSNLLSVSGVQCSAVCACVTSVWQMPESFTSMACPGTGHPPVEGSVNNKLTDHGDKPVNCQPVTAQHIAAHQNEFIDTIKSERCRLLKRIPKASRILAAEKLSKILDRMNQARWFNAVVESCMPCSSWRSRWETNPRSRRHQVVIVSHILSSRSQSYSCRLSVIFTATGGDV